MNHELLAAILTALISATGGTGVLGLWLSKKQKDKDQEREDRDKARDRQAEESQNWYRESREHYKTAKTEAAEARKECASCKAQLRITRNVVYELLESLEDEIVPMLPDDARKAVRSIVHRARESL